MPPLRNTGQHPEAERPEYAGQYRLESCLGTGGMGVVHLATSASGLRLAVKVIHAEHSSDPEFRARFRQEVAAARRVSGAFTAPVVDADPTAGRPWMATLFIDGPTLSERVKRKPLDTMELRRVGAGLAEALRDIHRVGVVHRDLKPSNVLLAQDGPKVIDFGISRPADSDLRTETGKLIGTPPFMAPEQFQRPREVGPAADVFAMGSVLVHAATGRGPFDSDSPYIVAYQVVHNEPDLTGVPTDLVPLLRRCLAKDPDQRPTPHEVMVALRSSTPSSSYDTQAYIPGPRTPDPREGVFSPGEISVLGDSGVSGFPGDSGAPDGPVAGRRGLSRRRWAVVVATAVALTVAAVVAVRVADDRPTAPAPAGAGRDFAGWSVDLRGGSAQKQIPVCTAGPAPSGLHCAAPGVTAVSLDPLTGKKRWTRKASGAASQDEGGMAPQYAGGLVHAVTPGGGRLEALDPKTGAVRWSTSLAAYSAVRHVGDLVLLVGDDRRVRAVDAATGEQRWERAQGGIGTEWVAAPGVGGPALAVTPSADGRTTTVTAVETGGGKQLWRKQLDGQLRPVQMSGRSLYLLSVDADGYTDRVVRLDTRTAAAGVRIVPLEASVDQAQATVVGDTVLLSAAGGSVLAVDASRGVQKWRHETQAAQLSRPVVDGRAVYVTAGDGRLLAIGAENGKALGQTKPRTVDGFTFAATLPAPVAMGGRVYGTAPDGSVFAVGGGAGGW